MKDMEETLVVLKAVQAVYTQEEKTISICLKSAETMILHYATEKESAEDRSRLAAALNEKQLPNPE